MSDWLEILRTACEAPGSSQASVAKRLNYSAPVVSQVLRGIYPGDLNAVKAAVEGALLGGTVPCPVIGEIPRQKCVEHQRSRPPMTNPTRAALSLACPTCPHNLAAKRGTGAAR